MITNTCISLKFNQTSKSVDMKLFNLKKKKKLSLQYSITLNI